MIFNMQSGGVMPDQYLDATTITPGTENQIIEEGTYLREPLTILGEPNLTPENIPEGVSLFGIPGTNPPEMFFKIFAKDGVEVKYVETTVSPTSSLSTMNLKTLFPNASNFVGVAIRLSGEPYKLSNSIQSVADLYALSLPIKNGKSSGLILDRGCVSTYYYGSNTSPTLYDRNGQAYLTNDGEVSSGDSAHRFMAKRQYIVGAFYY